MKTVTRPVLRCGLLVAGLALACAAMTPNRVHAQLRAGVSAGGAVVSVISDHADQQPIGRWSVGAWLRAPIAGRVGVQVEGRLSGRGYRNPDDIGVRYQAIEIPLLLSYDLSRREADASYITAGLVGVIERSCTWTGREVTFPGDLAEVPCDGRTNLLDPVESSPTELGAAVGIGTEALVGAALLTLDLRVVAGLTRLTTAITQRPTPSGNRTVEFAGRSVAIQLFVGIGIP